MAPLTATETSDTNEEHVNGTMAEESVIASDAKLQVQFTTKLIQYSITNQPILVPAVLGKEGLSNIINHLLGLEGDADKVSFNFLVNGNLLKTDLATYLKRNNLSTEGAIALEYIVASAPPKYSATFKNDDWVSAISAQDDNRYFLSGAYDSLIRLWNSSNECLETLKEHQAPITSVKWVHPISDTNANEPINFVSSSLDNTVRAYSYYQKTATCQFVCRDSSSPVNALDVNPSKSHFAGGCSDNAIRVWTTQRDLDIEVVSVQTTGTKKKRKVTEEIPVKRASCILNGHTDSVTAVAFRCSAAGSDSTLYSGSDDHTIRVWDMEATINTSIINGHYAVSSLATSKVSSLLAASFTSSNVKVYDPRLETSDICTHTFSTPNNIWTTCTAWSKTDSNMLATGGYDGKVRVWDLRSPKSSVYVFKPSGSQTTGTTHSISQVKILSLDITDQYIISGDTDGNMSFFKI